MCPLKEKCGGDVRPKWHYSDVRTVKTLGYDCPFAHHYNELKFYQEE